jgi:hypothetical protein
VGNTNASAKELLRRVLAAGLADRFQLRQVCPTAACLYLGAFEHLVEYGLVERVTERCGSWHYRLTAAGREAAAAEGPLRFRKAWTDETPKPANRSGKTRSLNCAGGSHARRKRGMPS